MPIIRKKIRIKDAADGEQGIKAIMEGLNSFFRDVDDITEELAVKAARLVITEADVLVPRDTNALAESWDARAVPLSRGGWKGVASYGGPTRTGPTRNAPEGIVDYAVIVHEDLSVEHVIGEAKYLEKGAEAAKPEIDALFKNELKKLVR